MKTIECTPSIVPHKIGRVDTSHLPSGMTEAKRPSRVASKAGAMDLTSVAGAIWGRSAKAGMR